uniref:Uncharacterized protein n=1 Tax=Arundo donax TaxID=35708 RepID=A0A0A9A670_ARUDO
MHGEREMYTKERARKGRITMHLQGP